MRAATIRRLLVFGVCALGVGSLYLIPGVTRVPIDSAQPPLTDEPTAATHPGRGGSGVSRQPISAAQSSGPDDEAGTDTPAGSREETRTSTETKQSSDRPSNGPGTTSNPDDHPDREAPARVTDIKTADSTHDRLDLSWAASGDNVGVVSYTVYLNGYPVATTEKTHTRLHWFNDDSAQHVVQVEAVDAAGNESETAAVVVTRPTDEPAPQPSDDPTSPAPEPSASETPAAATEDAGDQSTAQASPDHP